jgi:Rrf2 family protein
MQITRQADYAVRAVLYLSKLPTGARAPTSRIANDRQIPPSFLAKIISQLSVAGVVQTARGARGGVSLSRPPGKITLLEVVEAIDGPIFLNQCIGDPSSCEFHPGCEVHPVWSAAQSNLVDHLASTNFDLLTSKDRLREPEAVLQPA